MPLPSVGAWYHSSQVPKEEMDRNIKNLKEPKTWNHIWCLDMTPISESKQHIHIHVCIIYVCVYQINIHFGMKWKNYVQLCGAYVIWGYKNLCCKVTQNFRFFQMHNNTWLCWTNTSDNQGNQYICVFITHHKGKENIFFAPEWLIMSIGIKKINSHHIL